MRLCAFAAFKTPNFCNQLRNFFDVSSLFPLNFLTYNGDTQLKTLRHNVRRTPIRPMVCLPVNKSRRLYGVRSFGTAAPDVHIKDFPIANEAKFSKIRFGNHSIIMIRYKKLLSLKINIICSKFSCLSNFISWV